MKSKLIALIITTISLTSFANTPNLLGTNTNSCSEAELSREVDRRLEVLLGNGAKITDRVGMLMAEGGGNDFEDMDQVKDMLRAVTPKVTLVESIVSGCDKEAIHKVVAENATLELGMKEVLAVAASLNSEERACLIEVFSELE